MTRLAPQSAKAPHVAHLSEQRKKGMRRGRETKERLNLISTFAFPAVPTRSPGARPHSGDRTRQAAPVLRPLGHHGASPRVLAPTATDGSAGKGLQRPEPRGRIRPVARRFSSEARCISILKYAGFPQESRRRGERIVFL